MQLFGRRAWSPKLRPGSLLRSLNQQEDHTKTHVQCRLYVHHPTDRPTSKFARSREHTSLIPSTMRDMMPPSSLQAHTSNRRKLP